MPRHFSATTSVLDMFNAILGTAGRWLPDGTVDIVPVVATDLSTDLPLIEQIARHAGVPVLSSASAFHGVEPSPSIGNFRNVVESVELPTGRLIISTAASGIVSVGIGNGAYPTNPGLRNMLGALNCLLDVNLTGQRLAVVTYDESNMDQSVRETLWRLIMCELPRCGAAMPRTLVVIVGNESVTPEHLSADPSARYILRSSGLLQRHSWEVNQQEIAAMAAGVEPLILFLGAGSSVDSGLPLGDSLRNEALRNFFLDASGAPPAELVRRFYRWVVDKQRLLATEEDQNEQYFIDNLTLERVLREEKRRLPNGVIPKTLEYFAGLERNALMSPSPGILALRKFIMARPRLVLVTVNFDRLLEKDDSDQLAVMASDEQFEAGLEGLATYLQTGTGPVPLLKIHGSIDQPATIVADVETTALGLSRPRSEALALLAGQTSAPYKWAYVGYSMRDPDIMAELRGQGFSEGTDERWVAPTTDPTVEQITRVSRVPIWTKAGVPSSLYERTISETADKFFLELQRSISSEN